jgi:gliding motility-associated-like protein
VSRDSTVVTAETGLPILNPFPDTTLDCRNDTVFLDAQLPNGVEGRWCRLDANGNEDIFSCQFTELLAVSSPGKYRLRAENLSTGCQNGYTVTVGEDIAVPTVSAGSPATFFCTLDSLLLNGEAGPPEAPLRYSWTSAQDVPIGRADSLIATVFFPDRYYLRVENTRNGCAATDSVMIAQDAAAPQAFAGIDTSLNCQRRQVRLGGTGTTLSGQRTVEWQTVDGRILSGRNTLQPLVDRPGTYLLVVTDPVNSCATADAVEVTEDLRSPTAIVTAPDSNRLDCRRDTLSFLAAASLSGTGGSLSYTWRSLSTGGIEAGTDPATASVFRAGNYQLIVVDAGNACRDTTQFSVSIDRRLPLVELNNPAAFTCVDTLRTLRAVNSDSGPNFTYNWLSAAGDTLAQNVSQLPLTQTGTYRLLITDERNGCSAFAERQLTADRTPPLIAIASPAQLGCERTSVLLDASASDQGPELRYQWMSVSGAGLSGSGTQATVSVTEPGTYVLSLRNTRNGCLAVDSITVVQLATAIDSVLLALDPPSCTGVGTGTVMIEGVAGGTGPYRFRLDQGRASERLVYGDVPVGPHTITAIDANGCLLEVAFAFSEPETPFLDLGPDRTIQLGDSVLLQMSTDAPAYDTLIWEASGPLSQPGAPMQWVAPRESQRYRLTLVTPEGCRISDEVLITVEREFRLYVPSAFTPNGDGNNDLIFPFGGEEVVRVIRWRIYDRWGNLVHDRENLPPGDPNLGWDGTFDGRRLNPAVFVYQLELEIEDGRIITVYGDVTLVR